MRSVAVLFLLALLAGCGGSLAEELPTRTPGLWEVTLVPEASGRRVRPVVTRQCTAAVVDAQLLLAVAPGQEACSAPELRRRGEVWRVRTRCRSHDTPIDTRFELHGDFVRTYGGRFEARTGGSCDSGRRDCREAAEFRGRHLGACPAGMHPGEVRLPNGILINPLHHAAEHEAHEAPAPMPSGG